MDKTDSIRSDLKPSNISKSSIINNSTSETDDSSNESGKQKECKLSNHNKNDKSNKIFEKRSKHKSKRSSSKDNHRSGSTKHSRNRNRSRSRSSKKDKKRRDSSKSEHRKHRKRHSSTPKDYSPYRKHKDNRRDKDHKDSSNDNIYRGSKPNDYGDRQSHNKSRKFQHKNSEDLAKKAEEVTGVKIPSYLNTSSLNPLKYAETEQKRKLLWSKKDESKKLNIMAWNASSVIASRGDDRKAAKFRKLMGIHDEPNLEPQNTLDLSRKEHEQALLFSRLDADYQSARSQTHTSRGVGLGYNQSAYIDPLAYLAGRRDEN